MNLYKTKNGYVEMFCRDKISETAKFDIFSHSLKSGEIKVKGAVAKLIFIQCLVISETTIRLPCVEGHNTASQYRCCLRSGLRDYFNTIA